MPILFMHWCDVCAKSTDRDSLCDLGRAELDMQADMLEASNAAIDRLGYTTMPVH